MSYIERGLYRELLDECWVEGSIPNDIEMLSDICGCPLDIMANAWLMLSKCFVEIDGVLINERLENERTEKDSHRVKMAIAGKAGGIKKTLKINNNEAKASKSQANASKSHIEEKRREEESREENRKGVVANATCGDAVIVFNYWKETMNHPKANLDNKREKAIKARLKDGYSIADLCSAIDGCKKSPHHMGQNDRSTVYDDIELICRSAPHVDKFIKLAVMPDRSTMSDLQRKNVAAAEKWLASQAQTGGAENG